MVNVQKLSNFLLGKSTGFSQFPQAIFKNLVHHEIYPPLLCIYLSKSILSQNIFVCQVFG